MDALYETEATGREGRLHQSVARVEHWAYQVDSPFRPVHEILEAAERRSGTVPALEDEAGWRDANFGPNGEELEELEDLEYEDEDPEAENEGQDESLELEESDLEDEDDEEEDLDDDEDLEDEEEDLDEDEDLEDESTDLEESELADLPTADEGREREADNVSEFEDGLADQELEDELISRPRSRRRSGARRTRPMTRRIIVRRGDMLVIQWR